MFRKSNGELQVISSTVRKVYVGETDILPESVHEKLKIALSHDNVTIEGEKYFGQVIQDGDYNIAWSDFLDYPNAKGSFNAEVRAFNATNTNCRACDDVTGLELTDDRYANAYGQLISLAEGGTYNWDVADNDTICCSPVTFEIAEYNTDLLNSISISASGVITFNLKSGIPSLGEVVIATYRVTCPNGNYDEATLTIAIDGSIEVCNPPTNITDTVSEPEAYTLVWDAPLGGTPADGYEYKLFEATDLLTPVDTGTVLVEELELTGLTPNTQYVVQIRSVCGVGDYSGWISANWTTPPQSNSCGTYDVNWSDGSGITSRYQIVQYMACDGSKRTAAVYNDVGLGAQLKKEMPHFAPTNCVYSHSKALFFR